MVQSNHVDTSKLHKPVLLEEVKDAFRGMQRRNSEKNFTYFDGTFGRGGHYQALKEILNPSLVMATDQDVAAVSFANQNFPEVKIENMSFLEFAKKNTEVIDAGLVDLGVSSPQLDLAERGFSFNKDGPLDMRMNLNQTISAKTIIAEWPEKDLENLFKEFGEVEKSWRVVRAIVNDRATKPFETTLQLSSLIERVDGWTKKGFHPATQYFMALRLVVNRELECVEEGLPLLMNQLADGGRLAVITFHSLEDRLVKNLFRESDFGFPVNKKVIVPTDEECHHNPRARSAKLRVFQRGKPVEKPDKFALRRAMRTD